MMNYFTCNNTKTPLIFNFNGIQTRAEKKISRLQWLYLGEVGLLGSCLVSMVEWVVFFGVVLMVMVVIFYYFHNFRKRWHWQISRQWIFCSSNFQKCFLFFFRVCDQWWLMVMVSVNGIGNGNDHLVLQLAMVMPLL